MGRPLIVTARSPGGTEYAIALAEIAMVAINPNPGPDEWAARVWLRGQTGGLCLRQDDGKLLRAAWLQWSDP